MRLVVQRVDHANVVVDNVTIGKINKGYMVLLGVTHSDTKQDADYLVKKLLNLRIFEDENGKMNLSLKDINGELLIISQFTLYADCTQGNRPSFINAGKPNMANELYEYYIAECKKQIDVVQSGKFGAHMDVSLLNSGPVTIILDSKNNKK